MSSNAPPPSYADAWNQVTSDPGWSKLPPQQRQDLARFFARKFIEPTLGSRSPQMQQFLQENVLGPAPAPAPGLGQLFAQDVQQHGLQNLASAGTEAAREMLDNGPTALINRGLGQVASHITDAVTRPLGLPSSTQMQAMGIHTPGAPLLPQNPASQSSAAGQVGAIAGSFFDPVNLVAPVNAFEGVGPAAKAGINLLPKAAQPSVLGQVLRGALGAGATNAAIAAATSAGQQAINGQQFNLGAVGQSTLLGAALGSVMGGAGSGLGSLVAHAIASRADQSALARIAQMGDARPPAIDPQVSDSRMQNFLAARDNLQQVGDLAAAQSQQKARQTLQDIAKGLNLGDAASRDYLAPDSGIPSEPPVIAGSGPRQVDLGGTTLGQRAQAAQAAQQAAQYQAIADAASRDYLPAEEAQPSTSSQPDSAPPPQVYSPVRPAGYSGFTRSEREAAQVAQAQDGLAGDWLHRAQQLVDSQSRDYLKPDPAPEVPASESDTEAILQRHEPAPLPPDDPATSAVVDGATAAIEPGKFSRLVAEEGGNANPLWPGAVVRHAYMNSGGMAEAAGAAVRKADALYTGLIDKAMARTGIKGALGKLEEWRQAAKTAPTGSPVVEALRRGFISNYGVPPEVLDMADQAARDAHQAARPMREQALQLLGSLGAQHQHDLELAVTEPTLREPLISKIARESGKPRADVANTVQSIAQESGRLSGMLKGVGALTEHGQARWDGKYLPRTYEQYFPTLSSLARRSAGLVGSKGRGIEKIASAAKAEELKQQGWEFRGYTGPNAQKIRQAEQAIADARKDFADDKITREELDAKLEKLHERLLNHIQAPGSNVRMWRDYTLAERQRMGQLFHASNAMNTLASAFERDYRNGKLLQDIVHGADAKGEFAIDAATLPQGSPPPEGYTLISNAAVPGTGIKRWGALANHYVRDDVKHYLTWASDNSELLTTLRNIKTYTGVDLFKRMKTIWNPAYYVNNAMQNMPMLEMAGGSAGDLPQAFREVADNGEIYRALEDLGSVKMGHVGRELARNLQGLEVGTGTPVDVARWILRGAQNLEARGGDLAQATDDMFKVALVIGKMRQGLPLEAAAKLADKTFYNPAAVTAPAARVIEAMPLGSPFVRYAWYGLDKMPELILKNPAKAFALLSYFQAAKMLIDRINGTTPAQANARDQLVPDYLKQTGGLGYLPLPMKDSRGNPLILSTANWNPLNFADNADQLNLPYWPNTLMPGGPLAAGVQALENYDWFRQKPLRTAAGDQTAQFLWNALGPSLLADKAPKLLDATAGRQSYSGLPYDVPTAAANIFGVKAQPYVPLQGIQRVQRDYQNDAQALKAQIRYAEAMKARNPQDAAKYDAEVQDLTGKMQARTTQYMKAIGRSLPALEGSSR